MPLIEVTIAEGRTPEQIRAMMHEVHEAALRHRRYPARNTSASSCGRCPNTGTGRSDQHETDAAERTTDADRHNPGR